MSPAGMVSFIRYTACLISVGIAAASANVPGWHVVHPQTAASAGTRTQPSIRYGHTCNTYKGHLVSTHGYFYDRERHNATWLSDTWAMDLAKPGLPWSRVAHHTPHALAFSHYSAGRQPPTPCGRFGHASVVIGDALYLYGGHDGGYSRTNRQDYQPGHDFDELWRLDLTSGAWTRLPSAGPDGAGPGKRYLLAAAEVAGRMVLYGGLVDGQGDVWSYTPAAATASASPGGVWEKLAAEVPAAAGGPGRRVGHTLVGWAAGGGVGVVMYGGRSTTPPEGGGIKNQVFDDAWFFDLASRSWRKLQAGGVAAPAPAGAGDAADAVAATPPGRLYHAAMATVLPAGGAATGGSSSGGLVRVGLVAAGTLTSPGLTCAADAWAFVLDCAAAAITWARLPDIPAALYDTRGSAWRGAAYLQGGHLCALEHPGRPEPYPFWYVNEVLQLDLTRQPAVSQLLEAAAAAAAPAGASGGGGAGAGLAACRLRPDEAAAAKAEQEAVAGALATAAAGSDEL
ncbi:hypothetical protein HXX76_014624 [Chlamydomonas incerta]|uniref:Uncharacterized protein n=1 Tax=Chlamydomonas incerta TaxID=51695 RepID=A0A835VQP6_CHLIN|nr:hypothetical protein HXX76_014624 [Chlamydomonas incerta]|eukprot:KAG2424240.1 hypothetical protein HXX76_014624 [Chlamydomonas incerta]